MKFQMQNKINILIVNDEVADIEIYRDNISRHCAESLSIKVFGPEEAGNPEVGRTLLKALAEGDSWGSQLDHIDVLFVDYRMPDINGVEFLRLLRKSPPISSILDPMIPVVLMTKYESQLLRRLDKGIEEGVSGYVFMDRPLSWIDVEATAQRVFQERQREMWTESLMEIASALPNIPGKDRLCQLIVDTICKRCPNTKIFIREHTEKDKLLKLLAASPNIPEEFQRKLNVVSATGFPMLERALNGEVYWYNSFIELGDMDIGQSEWTTCQELDLYRGMSFPLVNEAGDVFGTISMYRREIDPPFTLLERNYAELMVKQISETWTTRRQRQQGIAYALFLREFSSCEDENLLFRKVVEHLHNEVNRGDDGSMESKITFKILASGTDKLICQSQQGHHLGVSRETDFTPSVYSQTSVSAWVARENRPRLIPVLSDEPDYFPTNPNMKSELCLPVAPTEKPSGSVMGVVNLECSEEHYYKEEDLEYAETLCRLTGHCVDRLRTRYFLSEVLTSLGESISREDLIDNSIAIIKKFTGYRLLLFVIRDSDKWSVTELDVDRPDVIKEDIVRSVETLLNDKERRTLLQAAFAKKDPVYYEPDLQSLPADRYFVPPRVLYDDEKLRSQGVFLMKSGEEVVGGLSLDFVITNALSSQQIDLLAHFARWIGRLILHDKIFEYLRKKVEDMDQIAAFTEFMSRIWHKSDGQLHSLRNLAEACLESPELPETSALSEDLSKLQVGIEQMKGLPTRMKALAITPVFQYVDVIDLWQKVSGELRAKAGNLDVKVTVKGPIQEVYGDKDILEMILYHLLDNALDACENAPNRQVSFSSKALSDSRIELRISDTGKAVSDDEAKKMVKLGYTTKPDGTGSGLYWVKRRTVDMRGDFVIKKRSSGPGMAACLILKVQGDGEQTQ